jgi:hypothetical protein
MSCKLLFYIRNNWCMLLARVFNNGSIVWDIPLSLLICRLRLCNPLKVLRWIPACIVLTSSTLLLNSLIAWRSDIVFYCDAYRLIELALTLTQKDTYRSLAHLYFFCGFEIYLIFFNANQRSTAYGQNDLQPAAGIVVNQLTLKSRQVPTGKGA